MLWHLKATDHKHHCLVLMEHFGPPVFQNSCVMVLAVTRMIVYGVLRLASQHMSLLGLLGVRSGDPMLDSQQTKHNCFVAGFCSIAQALRLSSFACCKRSARAEWALP